MATPMHLSYQPIMPSIFNPQEPHLIHQFEHDFYDQRLSLSIEGYIRDEMKFSSLEALITRIQEDIAYAKHQLQ